MTMLPAQTFSSNSLKQKKRHHQQQQQRSSFSADYGGGNDDIRSAVPTARLEGASTVGHVYGSVGYNGKNSAASDGLLLGSSDLIITDQIINSPLIVKMASNINNPNNNGGVVRLMDEEEVEREDSRTNYNHNINTTNKTTDNHDEEEATDLAAAAAVSTSNNLLSLGTGASHDDDDDDEEDTNDDDSSTPHCDVDVDDDDDGNQWLRLSIGSSSGGGASSSTAVLLDHRLQYQYHQGPDHQAEAAVVTNDDYTRSTAENDYGGGPGREVVMRSASRGGLMSDDVVQGRGSLRLELNLFQQQQPQPQPGPGGGVVARSPLIMRPPAPDFPPHQMAVVGTMIRPNIPDPSPPVGWFMNPGVVPTNVNTNTNTINTSSSSSIFFQQQQQQQHHHHHHHQAVEGVGAASSSTSNYSIGGGRSSNLLSQYSIPREVADQIRRRMSSRPAASNIYGFGHHNYFNPNQRMTLTPLVGTASSSSSSPNSSFLPRPPACLDKSSSSSLSSPPVPQYMPPPPPPPYHGHLQMGLGLGLGLGIGSTSSSSDNNIIRVMDPPPRRPHSGIWLMLQPSIHQAKEPFLPQVPRSYLRIKDGRMTIRLLIKYLVNKLSLDSESEVEIRCRGQQLEPYLTLQHVRDNIWMSGRSHQSAATLTSSLPQQPTATLDHVMLLQYGRTFHSPS